MSSHLVASPAPHRLSEFQTQISCQEDRRIRNICPEENNSIPLTFTRHVQTREDLHVSTGFSNAVHQRHVPSSLLNFLWSVMKTNDLEKSNLCLPVPEGAQDTARVVRENTDRSWCAEKQNEGRALNAHMQWRGAVGGGFHSPSQWRRDVNVTKQPRCAFSSQENLHHWSPLSLSRALLGPLWTDTNARRKIGQLKCLQSQQQWCAQDPGCQLFYRKRRSGNVSCVALAHFRPLLFVLLTNIPEKFVCDQ